MLNPDGVVNGNYRTGILGGDLNRQWDAVLEDIHPTIFHLKALLSRLQMGAGVALYCDLHGHVRTRTRTCDDAFIAASVATSTRSQFRMQCLIFRSPISDLISSS
jgi:hypothetical protein